MASKATTDLVLVAAIVAGGYLILKTTKLGEAIGGVGEGVSEAAGGLGAGIGAAGAGLGGGIGAAGEAAGLGISDILSVLGIYRAAGEAGTGEIERWIAGQEREASQEREIDIAAFELEKEEIAKIQAEQERKTAEEAAERSRLIEEEKTQYVEFATTLPEKFAAGLSYMWRYSPMGLLTSYIQGVVSVEEEAAPQQSAPTPTGAAAPTPTPTTTTISGGYFDPDRPVPAGYTRIVATSEPVSKPKYPIITAIRDVWQAPSIFTRIFRSIF